MALVNNYRASSVVSNGWSIERVVNGVKGFFKGDERRAVYRQTVRELEALSARDLADLGIHRSMIETVAHEAAYGK